MSTLKNKKYLAIIGLLALSAIMSWNFYFRQYMAKDTVDITLFPQVIQAWTAEDLPLSETDYAILETRNVFVRCYTSAQGDKVYLFIVYSQNNRKVSHPPEVCYAGGGVSIVDHTLDSIVVSSKNLLVDANRLSLEKGNARQIAFYWFKVGDSFTSSYWKQQLLIAIKTLLGRPASSALIRISADVVNRDDTEAVRKIKDFAQLTIPLILQHLP